VATFAAYPYLHPGPQAPAMAIEGTLYGSSLWLLASAAASTGQPVDARLPGGMLAGGVAAGAGGLVASQFFRPNAVDQLTVAASTGLGVGAGLGVAKLTASQTGVAE